MSLLREIQTLATSTDARVAELLRKCKILAAHLKSDEFNEWVDSELNGYSNSDLIPDYRIVHNVESVGQLFGSFGRQLSNAPLHTINLDPRIRKALEHFKLVESITVYEDLLRGAEAQFFEIQWPSNIIPSIADKFYEDYQLVSAARRISRGTVVKIVESVKNRVLGFALDIEKQNPQAGDSDINADAVPRPVVNQVFNQHFHGNVGNVATSSHSFDQQSTQQQSWQQTDLDFRQLAVELPRLTRAMREEADAPEHYEAVSSIMRAESEVANQDGSKVLEYLAKGGTWALEVATKIGVSVAAAAIKHSVGLSD